MKGLTVARDKELVKQKALDKVKAKDPHNTGKIVSFASVHLC